MPTAWSRRGPLSTGEGNPDGDPTEPSRSGRPDGMEFPPFMPTPLAALYCGFRTAKGLHAAFRKGKVHPYGRRGGSGTYVWKRDDLDEFLRGSKEMGDPVEVRDDGQDPAAGNLGSEGRRVLPEDQGARPTIRKVRGVPAGVPRPDPEPGRAREASPALRRA